MGTASLKWHFEHQHPEIELESGSTNQSATAATAASTTESASSSRKRKWSPFMPLWKLRSKEQRNDMFACTIPGWVESKTPLDPDSPRAQKIHRTIFEEMILDLMPFSEVEKPGYLRLLAELCPNFQVRSEKYYRSVKLCWYI